MSRRIGLSLAMLAMGLGLAWVPSSRGTAMPNLDQGSIEEVNECFADGWTAELAEQAALEMSLQMSVSVKPCRPCRDREWCTCTYPGGYNRISCDPCCYINYAGEIVCLD